MELRDVASVHIGTIGAGRSTMQITPEILSRALDEEHRGDPRPTRSVLRQILSRMARQGVVLTVVERKSRYAGVCAGWP